LIGSLDLYLSAEIPSTVVSSQTPVASLCIEYTIVGKVNGYSC